MRFSNNNKIVQMKEYYCTFCSQQCVSHSALKEPIEIISLKSDQHVINFNIHRSCTRHTLNTRKNMVTKEE